MKTVKDLNKRKRPIITIDDSLEKYKDVIISPKKLDDVNKMLKEVKLPKNKHEI